CLRCQQVQRAPLEQYGPRLLDIDDHENQRIRAGRRRGKVGNLGATLVCQRLNGGLPSVIAAHVEACIDEVACHWQAYGSQSYEPDLTPKASSSMGRWERDV